MTVVLELWVYIDWQLRHDSATRCKPPPWPWPSFASAPPSGPSSRTPTSVPGKVSEGSLVILLLASPFYDRRQGPVRLRVKDGRPRLKE